MEIKKIYFWFFAISILLVCLIGVQVHWLKKNTARHNDEIASRIIKAMEIVKNQLEDHASCIDAYGKTLVDTSERVYIIKQHRLGKKINTSDTINVIYDPDKLGMKPDTLLSEKEGRYPFPVSLDLKLSFRRPEVEKKVTSDIFKSARNFRDVITSKSNITSIVNMRLTDSLLLTNLKNQHIKIAGFGFGFLSMDNQRLIFGSHLNDTNSIKWSPYAVNLFEDNKFLTPYRLAIVINSPFDAYSFDLGSIFSIAIIILLILSFYLFGRLYIKQSQLSEMKTDFINNLTHEFNTPLANIGLAVETLEGNSNVSHSKIAKVISIISSESFRLRENIERILQVATLEKGNLNMQKEQIDLVSLITTVLTGYQLQCEELGGEITFSKPPQVFVYGDEVHLLNSICNLLDNAIKYKKDAPVIHVSLRESGAKVILQVADNGIGMTAETQQHIFEKFYRAHNGNIHNTKGFGLGLNYVRGIITNHGGKIFVQSKPGTGSIFTIQLPGLNVASRR